jgi:MSHA pilin protein MshD
MLNKLRRSAGVTLVELIVALVIMGVALAGMVAVYTATTRSSVDPVLVQQMQAIADNMMEEILMKPFTPTDPAPPAGGARINFDGVTDYNGYGTDGIRDVEGNAIPGLERYTVAVKVEQATLTGLTLAKPGDSLRVTVTVSVTGAGNNTSYPAPVVLTGWRTNPS